MSSITPAQIRGARGMLDWTMLELARSAGISVSTVKRLEGGAGPVPSDQVQAAVRDAFETAGVLFLDDLKSGRGIILKAPRCARA